MASTKCIEVAEQLQKNTEGVHAAGTSTAGGSSLTLTGGEVPHLDAELFEDPLLHPDQIACMLEYGRRFTEDTKVCTLILCQSVLFDVYGNPDFIAFVESKLIKRSKEKSQVMYATADGLRRAETLEK